MPDIIKKDEPKGNGREPAQSPSSADQPRVGVYVCQCGGNISDVVDCEKTVKALEKLPDVAVARTYIFMCSDPGQALIEKDIRENGINRVVVGACAPALHEATFRRAVGRAGLNPYLYYHVGLREQDSWVHHDFPEEATEKAIRLMGSGVAKARLLEPLKPIQLEGEKHVLVIGGGMAGLRAAWDMARRGLKVSLVEKSPFLGGRVARLDRLFPTNQDARQVLHTMIDKVLAEPNITVYTQAEVVGASGYVGNFQIRIRQHSRGVSQDDVNLDQAIAACPVEVPDEFNYDLKSRKAIYQPYPGSYPDSPAIDWEHCNRCGACLMLNGNGSIHLEDEPKDLEIKVGAVVMASGFKPYQPPQGELGYGQFPEVITLPQLERLLASDGPTAGQLAWGEHPIRNVVMIHCVGSRQVEGVHQPQPDGEVNNYCSRVCCTATLNAANQIRTRFPEVNVFDIYQDIRTYGRGFEDYYVQASKNRVTFLRYLAEEPPEVVRAPQGDECALLVKVKDHLTGGQEIEVPADLVVLAVGMMPSPVEDLMELFKISPGKDRFLLEVHPKLRPVETAIPGIVLAGTAQGPMNTQESSAAASAAASKVAVLLGQGQVQLEPYVARVDPDRCQGTGECVKACPLSDAIRLVTVSANGSTAQRAEVTPPNCAGCGACVSACPNRAIDLLGWSLEQYEAMLDALVMEIPEVEVAA
jgi:heterodisulfide reductase subunit A